MGIAVIIIPLMFIMQLKFKHFVFLNVLDVLLTWHAITHLGLSEGNPILSSTFQEIGLVFGLVCTKLIGLIALWGIINFQPLNIKKISINIICFMFIAVITNNIYQIAYTTFIL